MPRFKSIFFTKIALELSYFCKKKCKIFERWALRPQTPVPPVVEGFSPTPQVFDSWRLCPYTPIGLRRPWNPPPDPQKQPPFSPISCHAPASNHTPSNKMLSHSCEKVCIFAVESASITDMQKYRRLCVQLSFEHQNETFYSTYCNQSNMHNAQ